MGNTYSMKEVEPMPWKDLTVTKQRLQIELYLFSRTGRAFLHLQENSRS